MVWTRLASLSMAFLISFGAMAAERAPRFDGAPKFDSNVPPALRILVEADLQLLSELGNHPSGPLFASIFGEFSGPHLERWFRERVYWIGYDEKAPSRSAIAYTHRLHFNQIWLTPSYLEYAEKIPPIVRVGFLLHEARHIERDNAGWIHATCPIPFLDRNGQAIRSQITGVSLEGMPACDLTEMGSYGIESVFLLNVAHRCETCSEKMRTDAKTYGDDGLNRILLPESRARVEAEAK